MLLPAIITSSINKLVSKEIKFILCIFIISKFTFLLITLYGLEIIPNQKPGIFPWYQTESNYITRLANWDGGHYIGIAENGYLPFQVVFFPLYPMLIKTLTFFNIHAFWGAIIISNFSLFAALYYLYKLAEITLPNDSAEKSVLGLIIFPTAFYLGTAYNESVFLALSLAAIYYSEKKQYLISSILAGFSAVTRLLGLGIIFIILIGYLFPNLKFSIRFFITNSLNRITLLFVLSFHVLNLLIPLIPNYQFKTIMLETQNLIFYITLLLVTVLTLKILLANLNLKNLFTWPTLYIILSFFPFLSYILFLYLNQNNPLAFVNHEKSWGRELNFPWITVFNTLFYFKDTHFFNGSNAQSSFEFLFFAVLIIIFIYSLKKLKFSYNLYFLYSILIPISTGTFQAIHRYALIIFPIYLVFSLVKNKYILYLWIALSLAFQAIFAVLFMNGYWVT